MAPTLALIVEVPEPVPELVMVPALFTPVVDSVAVPPPVVLNIRLPVPVTPPLNVRLLAVGCRVRLLASVTAPLKRVVAPTVIVFVPVFPAATEMRFVKVPLNVLSSVAFAAPLVLPRMMAPVPNALALPVPIKVPASMVAPPEKVFTPESVSPEVELF